MKRIYLDHAAATSVDKTVLKEMNRVERDFFANASALYKEAVLSRQVIEHARKKIAEIISAHPDEIIFTGSGTESNNLALLGLAQKNNKQNHIIISAIEHPSVLEVANYLKERGFTVDLLPVDKDGIVDLKEFKKMLRPDTLFVSIMYANNEIGTIEPIRDIMKVIRKFRKDQKSVFPYFHMDACQATNYLDMNVLRLGIDLMAFNSPKIYGPKGAAALFIRRGVKIVPLFHGGGHERGLRSATEDTARIAGFAKALDITEKLKEKEANRLTTLRDYFIGRIKKEIPDAVLNGSLTFRLPNNVNFSFPEKDAEEIVLRLDAKGIAASTRSACANQDINQPLDGGSYVVRALSGADHVTYPFSSVRFTLGRQTTKKEIDQTVYILKDIIQKM